MPRLRQPLGLRARLLLSLVATASLTLLVAALALLSPLQQRLREQQSAGLRATALASLPAIDRAVRRDGALLRSRSFAELRDLRGATGAEVIATNGSGRIVYPFAGYQDEIDDVRRVLTSNLPAESRRGSSIRFAMPLAFVPDANRRDPVPPYIVVALRQPDTQVTQTVAEVRRAFFTAAIIGLVIAVVLGLVLSATLTRRLGRLRDAALRITESGMDTPVPDDDGPDEIGDLARAMIRMQAGLRRQEDARRRFVATASHELRTPLTSLSGNLELLGEDLSEDGFDRDDARRQVAAAQGEIGRLRNLATELLDLSRLDAGVALRSEPVELGEVARAVAAEFALQAHERRTLLEVVPPRGPCWALGDPDAVARVARILIDNALRYTPSSTAVRVMTGYAGEDAILGVIDDGPGVAGDQQTAIFERFQRGAVTRGEGGFGLGLAIGRELAERLGGRLELDPAPRRGARFVLALPIGLPPGGTEE